MVSAWRNFWTWVSGYGIPAGISPNERKLHVSANQLMMASIILIVLMTLSLLFVWLFLLTIDFSYYRNHFWGGMVPLAGAILGILIFRYRGKTGKFYGPIIAFAYLMTLLIIGTVMVFGGFYGLEYWMLIVMGMGIFVLHRKPRIRRLSIALSFLAFMGMRLWVLYIPEFLPVPHIPTRIFYYFAISVAMFIILVLEFRFITYQSAQAEDEFIAQRDIADRLLLNIMPQTVATELKTAGRYEPRHYDGVTVLFTDFVGFTKLAASMTPAELLASLDECFSAFDAIVQKHGLEKLKTIGDSYMCAAGIPEPVQDHAERACRAATEFLQVVREKKGAAQLAGRPYWDIRIGLHTGPLVAGIIGSHKFAYDIWGDTVNIASRMESAGAIGKVNLSATTASLVRGQFSLRSRGLQNAKGIGETEMFEIVTEN